MCKRACGSAFGSWFCASALVFLCSPGCLACARHQRVSYRHASGTASLNRSCVVGGWPSGTTLSVPSRTLYASLRSAVLASLRPESWPSPLSLKLVCPFSSPSLHVMRYQLTPFRHAGGSRGGTRMVQAARGKPTERSERAVVRSKRWPRLERRSQQSPSLSR